MVTTKLSEVDKLYNELYTNVSTIQNRLAYYVGDVEYATLQNCIDMNKDMVGTRNLVWTNIQNLFKSVYGPGIQSALNQSGKSASSQQQALNQITAELWNTAKKPK